MEIKTTSKDDVVTIKDYTSNPNRFSFGKILFTNGTFEAWGYFNEDLNNVFLAFSEAPFAKSDVYHVDVRRSKEVRALITKVAYYLSLTDERKRKWLAFHGHFANVIVLKKNNNHD